MIQAADRARKRKRVLSEHYAKAPLTQIRAAVCPATGLRVQERATYTGVQTAQKYIKTKTC